MRFALAAAVALAACPCARADEPAASDIAHVSSQTANPLTTLRLADLNATRDRPLFSPTRRPAPAADAAPSITTAPPVETKLAAPEPPPFDLLGAVLGKGVGYILVRNRITHQVERLNPNDDAGGWKVGAVSARSVTLERNGGSQKLTLGEIAASVAPPTPPSADVASLNSAETSNTAPSPHADSPPQAEYDRLMRKLNLH